MQFTRPEVTDLIKAWLFVALVFALATRDSSFALDSFLYHFLYSAIVVGLAVIIHELAHKFTAQKYGLQAHFESFDGMLWFSLILSFFGFIFLAPGAVMVRGGDRIRMGRIALAGPISNIVMALGFLAGYVFFPSPLLMFASFINAFLALFNMLPVFVLDGKKVLAWNKTAFGVTFGVSLLLVILVSIV